MGDTLSVGRRGESIAAAYLEQNGYRLLCRNYRHGHREIDLIARDDTTLIFCEVKARSVLSCAPEHLSRYGRPSGAVDTAKQKNLTIAARAYLTEHPTTGLRMRFDVIEVYLRHGSLGARAEDVLKVHHIRNAFYVSPRY